MRGKMPDTCLIPEPPGPVLHTLHQWWCALFQRHGGVVHVLPGMLALAGGQYAPKVISDANVPQPHTNKGPWGSPMHISRTVCASCNYCL